MAKGCTAKAGPCRGRQNRSASAPPPPPPTPLSPTRDMHRRLCLGAGSPKIIARSIALLTIASSFLVALRLCLRLRFPFAALQDFLEADLQTSRTSGEHLQDKAPFTAKVISVKRIVGPGAGETCHIIMNHRASAYWEGQSWA